jgi:hypothetical protein
MERSASASSRIACLPDAEADASSGFLGPLRCGLRLLSLRYGFAAQYNKAPPQFHEWKLREWIDVLARIGDLSPNVEKFGHALRDFRNYVHPAEQLAHRFSPDHHTARIGFQVVVAAAEDLVRAGAAAKDGGAPL